MCGIVGYIGPKDACPILLKGLHRLEYRGYDSAGVALINNNGSLSVYKSKGKVADLENHIAGKDISGTIGVAHTRWATHGEPNTTNAHPHYSQSGNLALIHNGIIENYKPLKQEMMNHGRTFQSETDTEVLIQFIEYIKERQGCDLFEAVQLALKNVIGAYAIVVIDKHNPNRLIAARKGSPLVIGVGENEFYIGSDATPLIEYTNKVIYLGEEEIAMMTREGDLQIVNLENVAQTPLVKTLEMSLNDIEKGGFPHYMLKEIFEQPDALLNSMKGRLNTEEKDVLLSSIINHREEIQSIVGIDRYTARSTLTESQTPMLTTTKWCYKTIMKQSGCDRIVVFNRNGNNHLIIAHLHTAIHTLSIIPLSKMPLITYSP